MRPAVVLTLLAILITMGALVADAQTLPGRVRRFSATTTCGSTTCSGTAPSAASDGVGLQTGTGLRIRLCADSGQTLSGAGTLSAYVRDETDGLWSRVPALDKTVPGGASGLRCVGWDENAVLLPYGATVYVPASVTVSGGNLTVTHYVATLGR